MSAFTLLGACGGDASLGDAGHDTSPMDAPAPRDTLFTSEESFPDVRPIELDAFGPDGFGPDVFGLDAAGIDAPVADDAAETPDAYTGDVGPMPCAFVESIARGCTMDADCAIGIHQTNCCGDSVALGVSSADAARFEALEPACRDSYPLCGCPSHPTVTDSGESAPDPSMIQVACVARGPAGICQTFVTMRPMDGL